MRVLALAALALGGCYSHTQVAVTDLEKLTAVPGRAPEADLAGQDCDGCPVRVDGTTPLVLTTKRGLQHRVTPFYFHMNDTPLGSPDYGVLVDRAEVRTAEVRTLSTGGTSAMVVGIAAIAAGTFLAIQLTAGDSSIGSNDAVMEPATE